MKVRAIINFNDLKENTRRQIGDVFECDEERAKHLLEHKAVEIVEEPIKIEKEDIEVIAETVNKTTKKKKTSKK